MIGDIMLLIPGLLLVNAIKEMFNRDIVTGLYRLIEAVLVALAIAGGYALAFLVMGGGNGMKAALIQILMGCHRHPGLFHLLPGQ